MILYRSSVADVFVLKPCIRICSLDKVQRAIDDAKRIFCKINEDFCQFKFNFVHKVCVFSFFYLYYLI